MGAIHDTRKHKAVKKIVRKRRRWEVSHVIPSQKNLHIIHVSTRQEVASMVCFVHTHTLKLSLADQPASHATLVNSL